MRILIVEDEHANVAQLERELVARTPLAPEQITVRHEADFEGACTAIKEERFDLIVCDLLLLPPGFRLSGASLHNEDTGERERFSPKHWREYVVEAGGVMILRLLRSARGSRNRDTAVVVASWFDDLPGFKRILRMIDPPEEDLLVVIPKPATVRHVAERLPAGLRYQEEPLRAELDSFYSTLLRHGRPSSQEVAAARDHATRVRSLLKACRLRSARIALGYDDDASSLTQLETSSELNLHIEPDASTDLLVQMYRSDCNQFYALEGLYEDWVALRDHVLFNPHVGVSIDIGVLPRYADPHAPHQLDLRPYKSLPDEGFVATANAREVALRLIERCILVYIAFSSEPIRAADVGWSISQLSLRNGAFEDLEHLYRQPYVTDGMLAWPTLDEPVALRRELERVVDGAAVRDRIRSVRSTIQGAIPGPPDMVGREFDNNDLLVEVKQPDNESGYYFNGDLEICVPTFQTYTPAPEEEQRVAFFALGEELTLECLDGRAVGVEQLRARFVDSGVPVHVESADPFSTLERVLHRDFVDATAIMLAPANEDMLQRFIDPSNRAHWISLMGERRVPTILVLDHNVRVRERGTIDQLREDGIELMYPSPLPDALDLTKMLDHVVCAGHRTRYLGLRRDPAAADVSAREFAAAEFLEHFRILLGMGYDGDPRSGSMSKRLGRGPRFAISTTKTDKSSLGADGVAIVESYSLATNELVWSGTQRPSSTSPWHSLIYAAFPEIKYIVHTHWKDITYHDALAEFRTPRYVPTGHPAEAADVVTTLVATRGRHGLGGLFAILADHGEVFIGRSPAEMLKTVHVARQRAGSGVFS